MPIVIETVEEFRGRHGDSVFDQSNGREYFQDGAMIVDRARYDPPTDEKELDKQLANYAQTKLNGLVMTFNKIRTNFQTQAKFHQMNVGPPPSPDAIPALKKLAEEIIEWKGKVQKLDRKLYPTIESDRTREDCTNRARQVIDQLNQLPSF